MKIALLLGQGFSNREIAHRLLVSERTVRAEVAQIWDKLGPKRIKSRAQIAVRLGEQNPLVSAAAPEAAWVKFWASPGLVAAVAGILMLVVGLHP
jgi:DNA-binding CsgD family transcriptional regulator